MGAAPAWPALLEEEVPELDELAVTSELDELTVMDELDALAVADADVAGGACAAGGDPL